MDLHVLVVIACVFLASLFSLLFINKFFRGKTFEEVVAEKKLLAEKLYGPKVKKQRNVPTKKEIKKQKKQIKSKEADTSNKEAEDDNDSEAPSDTPSNDNSPQHKKPHVEFSDPEIVEEDIAAANAQRRASNTTAPKQVKRKVSNTKAPGTGILINKTEPIVIKETLTVESLNTFDVKHPKDVLEVKKQSKEETVVETGKKEKSGKDVKKQNKVTKKESEKPTAETLPAQISDAEVIPAIKEIKKVEEKPAKTHDSPKTLNKQEKNKNKKKIETSILDKLESTDVIGVNCLMSLFSRAELNRSEIQILIDYLLNKQQDTLANHSEWSDDIVQKLKKQLNEKEKALQEEQEASAGIQAKLRDLRTEINTERATYNATLKAYVDDVSSKKSEIQNLTQEIQNITEKFNAERQQYQAKLRQEKQSTTQEHAQLQQLTERNNILQNEIVQKNTVINELQIIVQASHQAVEETKAQLNEIIQQQANKIHSLEQNLSEAEQKISRLQYDLDMSKVAEKDKDNSKVEIRNLQNALDSTQAELNLARNDVNDGKNTVEALTAQIEELNNKISSINAKIIEHTKESNELKSIVANYKDTITEKDRKIADYEVSIKSLSTKEDELIKQINEQKEKNNDLRTKNWKLVEALQKAETTAVKVGQTPLNNLVTQQLSSSTSSSSSRDEQKVRDLFERLFPEATKATASSALSLSFDQWIEHVVAAHNKQIVANNQQSEQISNNNKLQTNNIEFNNSNHNHHNQHSTQSNNHYPINDEHSNGSSSSSRSSSGEQPTRENLLAQNAQLRAHIDELTSIVTKTENLLRNLETQARDQEAYWRSVVQLKQEEINTLKNPNGEAI